MDEELVRAMALMKTKSIRGTSTTTQTVSSKIDWWGWLLIASIFGGAYVYDPTIYSGVMSMVPAMPTAETLPSINPFPIVGVIITCIMIIWYFKFRPKPAPVLPVVEAKGQVQGSASVQPTIQQPAIPSPEVLANRIKVRVIQ